MMKRQCPSITVCCDGEDSKPISIARGRGKEINFGERAEVAVVVLVKFAW